MKTLSCLLTEHRYLDKDAAIPASFLNIRSLSLIAHYSFWSEEYREAAPEIQCFGINRPGQPFFKQRIRSLVIHYFKHPLSTTSIFQKYKGFYWRFMKRKLSFTVRSLLSEKERERERLCVWSRLLEECFNYEMCFSNKSQGMWKVLIPTKTFITNVKREKMELKKKHSVPTPGNNSYRWYLIL